MKRFIESYAERALPTVVKAATKQTGRAASKSAPSPPNLPATLPDGKCGWAVSVKGSDDLKAQYLAYHDHEWGRPLKNNDRMLFELLTLEGAQAGLSWSTVLSKRENYRKSFHGFDPKLVSEMTPKDVDRLLEPDSGIIKHRGKIESTISNAKLVLGIQQEHGSFSDLLWGFVPNSEPIVNRWTSMSDVPARTAESDALSKALKDRGFKFVGSTIMYAFMQATGMVDDHLVGCPCKPHR